MLRRVASKWSEPVIAGLLFRGPAHALGALFIVLSAAVLIVLLAAGRLYATAPVDALSPRLVSVISNLMPEGWAFFTKSPRLDLGRVWLPAVGDTWRALEPAHNNSWRESFGMDRRARVAGLQLAFLQKAIEGQPGKWLPCKVTDVQRCIREAARAPLAVVNPSREPIYCGQVTLEAYRPQPFEWRHLPQRAAPNKVAVFDVACPNRRNS